MGPAARYDGFRHVGHHQAIGPVEDCEGGTASGPGRIAPGKGVVVRFSLVMVVILSLVLTPGTGAAQAKKTCNDFQTQEDAQAVLDAAGTGSDASRAEIEESYDLRALDSDGDGIACETLPRAASSQGDTVSQDPTPSPASEEPESPTRQEDDYLRALRDDATELLSVMEDIVSLFEQAQEPSTHDTDAARQEQIAGVMSRWVMVSERASTLDPSTRQQHIHDTWLEVGSLGLKASDDILLGIQDNDADALARGVARMSYSALLIEDVAAAVASFEDDPDAPFEPKHALYPVRGCEELPNYDEAQQYYAAYPEEQPSIDSNRDGRACEAAFGVSTIREPAVLTQDSFM
jgi:hypothetical protein